MLVYMCFMRFLYSGPCFTIYSPFNVMSNFRPWKPRYKETILMQLCVKAFMKIKLETSEWRNDFESEEEFKKL
jgi:hypothetical protein